jgi:hypothetical protein
MFDKLQFVASFHGQSRSLADDKDKLKFIAHFRDEAEASSSIKELEFLSTTFREAIPLDACSLRLRVRDSG